MRFRGPRGLVEMDSAVSQALVPQRLVAEAGRFRAVVTAVDLGEVRVVRAAAAPLRAVRAAPRASDGSLFVLLGLGARGEITHAGGRAPVDPGHIVLIPEAAAFDVSYPRPLDVVFVALTAGRAARLHPGLAGPVRTLELTPPGRAVLGRALDLVVRTAASADVADRADLGGIVDAALAVALRPLAGENTGDPAAALRAGAFHLIERHLEDAELGPRWLAARLHVAPSTLHRAFSPTGETVAELVRRLRVEAVARDLVDPAHAATTVATLAARYGFASASHLAGIFRAAFGMTPAAYRDASALRPRRG